MTMLHHGLLRQLISRVCAALPAALLLASITACAAQVPASVMMATTSTVVDVPSTVATHVLAAEVRPAEGSTTTLPPVGDVMTPTVEPTDIVVTTTTTGEGPPEPSTTMAPGVAVVPVLRSEESTDPPYVVEISMPELVDHPDAAVEGRINATIGALVAGRADPFIADLIDYLTEFPPDPGVVASSFEMGYEVTLLNGSVLAIRFFESYYTAGAASPSGDISTLVFDLESGDTIGPDLLLTGPGAVERLAEEVRSRLIAEYFDGDAAAVEPWIQGALAQSLENLSPTPDALEVGFGQYEVGPGSIGTPIVSIPYADLDGVIDLGLLGMPG